MTQPHTRKGRTKNTSLHARHDEREGVDHSPDPHLVGVLLTGLYNLAFLPRQKLSPTTATTSQGLPPARDAGHGYYQAMVVDSTTGYMLARCRLLSWWGPDGCPLLGLPEVVWVNVKTEGVVN